MEKSGGIIKDISVLLTRFGFQSTEKAIGGFGSVRLYIASKNEHL